MTGFHISILVICLLAIAAMAHKSFIFRSVVLVVAVFSCSWLLEFRTDVTIHRQLKGHLNRYAGDPYQDLCVYLEKLSAEDPERLRKTLLILAEQKNRLLFYNTWLGINNKDYALFVQKLISEGSKTNQLINETGAIQQ
jgi:hypothetical protein